MKITKHYQFLLIIVGLYIVSFTVNAYSSAAIAIIVNAMVGVGIIATIICWIMFAVHKRRNRKLGLNKDNLYCPKCGNKILESANYCRNCGQKIREG